MNINCFIINLERCPDKKQRMIERMKQFPEIEYEFFNAIDGQKIDKDYLDNNGFEILNEWNDPFHNRKTTKGEIGCFLSHYFVYQKSKDLKNDITLILEDDAVFEDNFLENLKNTINNFSKKGSDYDMCYLSRKNMSNIPEKEIIFKTIINGKKGNNITTNLVKPNFSYWAIGYLIKRSFCEKILSDSINIIKNVIPIDELLPLIGNLQNNPKIEFKKYYNVDINICSVNRNIINPEPSAFVNSDTEISSFIEDIEYSSDLKIITVATDDNEPLQRFKKSCNNYGLNYKILGLNEEWKGGDMKNGRGGGMKLNLLKKELKDYDNDDIILFTDSYDVIFLSDANEIIKKYNNFDKQLIFAGEKSCWPDTSLENIFTDDSEYKYINSGGFIGKVSLILELLNIDFKDDYDDQLLIHQRYLEFKDKIGIDIECNIFQTSSEDIKNDIKIDYGKNRITNTIYNTKPCHYHGNGGDQTKVMFNNHTNYLLKTWNPTYQYHDEKIYDFTEDNLIFISLIIKNDSNNGLFFENFFKINYPKKNLILKIYYEENIKIDIDLLKDFQKVNFKKINGKKEYEIRDESLKESLKENIDYYFTIDSNVIVENENIVQQLIQYDKNIVSPMFKKKEKMWSNFWGETDEYGWYSKSFNYENILFQNERGCWNVPYINNIYLIKSSILKDIQGFYSLNYSEKRGYDMSFCENCRYNNIFLHLANENYNGYLIDNIDIKDYLIDKQQYIKKYLHDDFINKTFKIVEPIQDVIQFPFVNDLFCEELIKLSEKYGKWSGASNKDSRIGYENVPTNDIHFTELNIHKMWEELIKDIIAPIVSEFWGSYSTKNLNIGFVVKYEHDKFYKLEPHHDSSAYTINIALNDDYEGGEVNFIKKGKIKNKKGYALLHPGRITHYHEGLPVTKGTKYINVSFVN